MSDSSTPPSEADLDFGPTLRGLRGGLKVFGRYELIRQIGRGGMGVVWLARDTKLDLQMALKFLPENLVHDEIALDDLRRETRRCLKLTHQNIVHVFDLVDDEATAAIAMEYVEGRTLSAMRLEKANRVFEPADILPWLQQVCEALEYAHTKAKIVHHDLKPGNLMLSSAGEVKVMDFGIASSIGDSMSRVSKAAKSSSGSGTLPYMSPQQLMGFPPSVSDDVYALGATIYELLTGKPPFFRGSLESQIQSVMPPSMTERRQELNVTDAGCIPEVWEDTIKACLSKDPVKRPQNVMGVWHLLNQAAKVPAIEPNTPGVAATRQDEEPPLERPRSEDVPEPTLQLKAWPKLFAPAIFTGGLAVTSVIFFMEDHVILACGFIVCLFTSLALWFSPSAVVTESPSHGLSSPRFQLKQVIQLLLILHCVLSFLGTIAMFSMDHIFLASLSIALFFVGIFVWRLNNRPVD